MMPRAALLVVTALFTLVPAARAAPAKTAAPEKEMAALFPFAGNVPESQLRLLDAAVRRELERAGLSLLSEEDRRVHTDSARSLGLGCDDERAPACLYYVDEVANLRWTVLGAARDGQVTLELYEAADGTSVRRASAEAKLPPPGEPLVPTARALVAELLPGRVPSGEAKGEEGDHVVEAPVEQPPVAGENPWLVPAVGAASVGSALVLGGGVSLGLAYAAMTSPFGGKPSAEDVESRSSLITTTTWLGAGLCAAGVAAIATGAGLGLLGGAPDAE